MRDISINTVIKMSIRESSCKNIVEPGSHNDFDLFVWQPILDADPAGFISGQYVAFTGAIHLREPAVIT